MSPGISLIPGILLSCQCVFSITELLTNWQKDLQSCDIHIIDEHFQLCFENVSVPHGHIKVILLPQSLKAIIVICVFVATIGKEALIIITVSNQLLTPHFTQQDMDIFLQNCKC